MNEMSPIAVHENQLRHGLLGVRRQIESLLSDKAKSDKFMAAALVVAKDKTFVGANVESIVQSLVGVAMSDLNIDRNIGQVYLVKYGDDVNLQIGYKGFIQLLFRAGWLCKTQVVYQCDHFKMSFDGWDNRIEFEPDIDGRDEADKDWVYQNFRGVYVVARHSETKDEYSDFIPKAVIEKLRLISPNQTKPGKFTSEADKKRITAKLPIGIWRDWYSEMATAKAIKKLSKKLPLGDSRVQMAIAADDKADIGGKVDYVATVEHGVVADIQKEPEPEPSQKQNLNDIITGKKSEPEPVAQTVSTESVKTTENVNQSKKEPDEVNWYLQITKAKDDEALMAVMRSVPDNEMSKVFDEFKDAEFLKKCYLMISPEKQDQFGGDYELAHGFLVGKG